MTNLEKLRTGTEREIVALLCRIASGNDNAYHCDECIATETCSWGHTGFIDWVKEEYRRGN